jgi:putative transposase
MFMLRSEPRQITLSLRPFHAKCGRATNSREDQEAAFCIAALEEALARHSRPEIFNTDQGSQFTSSGFTNVLVKNGIASSMDRKGSWRDNVFVERLWRSIKYEEVYLRAYDTVSEPRASIGRYLTFYDDKVAP